MIKVDNKVAANKYVSAKEYVPDDSRPVIVYTDYQHFGDYDLGYYSNYTKNWRDNSTGITIYPNYWREIPKID